MDALAVAPGPDAAAAADDAAASVLGFALEFGDLHLLLAYHAAFPLVLTPDLLYRLREAFVPSAPWTAVADVLLSPLCREVAAELYEMPPAVRDNLLAELRADPGLGPKRLAALADFMYDYTADALRGDDTYFAQLAAAQRLAARAVTAPDEAAAHLAAQFSAVQPGDLGEQLRLTRLVASLASALRAYPNLLAYARASEALARGDWTGAATTLDRLGGAGATIEIAGVTLPLPRLRREAPGETAPAPGRRLPAGTRALCIGVDFLPEPDAEPPPAQGTAGAQAMADALSARGAAVQLLLGAAVTEPARSPRALQDLHARARAAGHPLPGRARPICCRGAAARSPRSVLRRPMDRAPRSG